MQCLLYLKHSQTPPRARKRMHEDMQAQAFPGSVEGPANDAYAACFVPAPAISAVEAFQAGGRPKRMKEKRKPKTGGPCTNCGTAMSSMWRPHNSKRALCVPATLLPASLYCTQHDRQHCGRNSSRLHNCHNGIGHALNALLLCFTPYHLLCCMPLAC